MTARGLAVGVHALTFALALALACQRTPQVDASALGLPTVSRSAAATQGPPGALLAAYAGELAITAANDATIELEVGAPLLADDRLELGDDGLVLLALNNGNLLRVEGPLKSAVQGLAGFHAAAAKTSLEDQLRLALNDDDRRRLAPSTERIGGWQLRLRAAEGIAAEEAAPPASPTIFKAEEKEGGAEELKIAQDDADDGDIEAEVARATSYSGASRPAGGLVEADTKKKQQAPSAEPPPNRGSKAGAGVPPSNADDGPATPSPTPPPWRLKSTTIVDSGAPYTLREDLRRQLIACLRTVSRDQVTVEITVAKGMIMGVRVPGTSLKCVDEFRGTTLPGITAGDLRLVLRRE